MALLDEYVVGADGPWEDRQAGHLFRRAGFGATPADRAVAVGGGTQADLRASVDFLVNIEAEDPYLDQPATGSGGPGAPLADLPETPEAGGVAGDLSRVKTPVEPVPAIGHWLYRMRYSSQPLQEQLALFLHDHMVTEVEKLANIVPQGLNYGNDGSLPGVQECSTGTLAPDEGRQIRTVVKLALDQNDLFRRTGIDDFRELLINVTRDAAMLIYLDNIFNTKAGPNENYARELMELFSMGVGNYNENDVREIAKCLTGETFPGYSCPNDYSLEPGFLPSFHVAGNKFVFGRTVPFDNTGGETLDVIDLILGRVGINPNVTGLGAPYTDLPATAVYMAWKLLRWFVSHDVQLHPVPDAAVLELAHYLRGTDNAPYPQRRFPYDLRACLRKLFLSRYFYDEAHLFAMYKTPADFVVSALRALEIGEFFTAMDGPGVLMILMGMQLFNPPNVAGWNHGKAWLTSGSVVVRYLYAFRVAYFVALDPDVGQDIGQLLPENGGPLTGLEDHEGMIDFLGSRLIQDEITGEDREKLMAFLEEMPAGENIYVDFYRKVLGLTHLMITMPQFQLK